jgi:hypothetical protein
VAVSFIGGGNRNTLENQRPVASHWQTLSHNVASSTPHLSRIRTHNVSGEFLCMFYSHNCCMLNRMQKSAITATFHFRYKIKIQILLFQTSTFPLINCNFHSSCNNEILFKKLNVSEYTTTFIVTYDINIPNGKTKLVVSNSSIDYWFLWE